MKDEIVGVVGVGLIGGSIALAAAEAGYRVLVFDPFAGIDQRNFSGIEFCKGPEEVADQATLIFIATPISVAPRIVAGFTRVLASGKIISDVASVKHGLANVLAELTGRADYVPSHPMTGSEKSGSEAARGNLFRGCTTIISPDCARDRVSVERVSHFWETVGSKPVLLDVAAHDEMVAAISHLPHLLAVVLMASVRVHAPKAMPFAGPGFRDVTRIAAGSPVLWSEILVANRSNLIALLAEFRNELREFTQLLETNDVKNLQAFLGAAKKDRDQLSAP